MDALARVMFETAILRYLEENQDREYDSIIVKDFVYDNGTADGEVITSIDQFWTVSDGSCSGDIRISGIKSGETFTEYTARYICGAGNQLYDFIVDFGDYSQLTVTMNGFSGVRYQRGVPDLEDANNGVLVGDYQICNRITTETERTAISWNRPAIAKGGAA